MVGAEGGHKTVAVSEEALPGPSLIVCGVAGSSVLGEGTQAPLDSHVTVIDYPHLRPRLLETLNKFRSTIALPGEPLGTTNLTEHTIKLKAGTSPSFIPVYRLLHSQDLIDKQIREMKEQGIIIDSRSPWNSPLFLVPKKDGTFRPVIAFRRVNDVTVGEQFPLPVLSDLMNLGEGNKSSSSLDLLSGYWQVPMDPESRKITAFSNPSGHFEWLRMLFGLKSAPITFQRMITTLLGDLKGKITFAYLDDIIIASADEDSHLASLEAVLDRLRTAGLKVKLSKCEFLKNKIKFLGHEVDSSGIHTQADKVEGVDNFPVPKTVDNVRSFLGLAGYYRSFIRNVSQLASPLNQL